VVQALPAVPGIGVTPGENPLMWSGRFRYAVAVGVAVTARAKAFDFTRTVHSNVKGPHKGVLRLHCRRGGDRHGGGALLLARDGEIELYFS